MHALLKGTIDFYDFITLSLTLTLPRGLMVCAKQSLVVSVKAIQVHIPMLFLNKINETREMTAVLKTSLKKKPVTLACIGCLKIDLIQTWCDYRDH